MGDRGRDTVVGLAALLVGLLGLGLVVAMAVGTATYDEGPPMLGPEAIAAMADLGYVVVPDEEATREHVEEAKLLAARGTGPGEMSLAQVTSTGTGEDHGLVWVVYYGRVEARCFGGPQCGPGPHYGRGWAFHDADTLTGLSGGVG